MAAPHIVVLPMPLQGHLNPLLWLVDYFVSSGLSVTFVLSARLFSLLSRNPSSSTIRLLSGDASNPRIEVVPDGLPVKTSLSRDELFGSFAVMKQGVDALMKKLIQEERCPPSCIVTESVLPWTQQVADKHGIPRIELWTCSATVYALGMVMPELAVKGDLPLRPEARMKMVDVIAGMPPFPLRYFPKILSPGNTDPSAFDCYTAFYAHNRKVDRVLLYTFYDLESVAIDALRALQIPVQPVGPFLSTNKERSHASILFEDRDCLDWLDAQKESSVLYVAFGSMAALDEETLTEIAIGLKLSQVPVLWVIRADAVKADLSKLLPEEFQSKSLQARVRIISWAPQLKVLAHPAIRAFLTHCGWNSTLESLYMGVPIIGFPDAVDQLTNLRCMMDLKVGLELEQEEEGGARCNREAVESVVRAMMEGEQGKEAQTRAKELSKSARRAIEDGSSKANLEKLVEDLKSGRVSKTSVALS